MDTVTIARNNAIQSIKNEIQELQKLKTNFIDYKISSEQYLTKLISELPFFNTSELIAGRNSLILSTESLINTFNRQIAWFDERCFILETRIQN